MVKVVGYIRVSTSEQASEDKFGLPVQREELESYCRAKGYDLLDVYVDEGISGSTLDRPELNRMLSAAKDFAKVIVPKYDRISRDLYGQLFIEKELAVKGVELESVREPFNGSTPEMALMRQMMGAFAEFEKQRIAQRLATAREYKRKQGGFAGGRAPLGYTAEKGSKRLHINADKVDTVRRLFALRAEGLSLQSVADRLNDEGHTTQDGKHFTQMQVKRALDREDLYLGNLEADPIL
ncbi:recombinase family protein [Cytobacillus oceanisediminis]|uniref:Resolvase n=1 Tax=Cytobacillus oceanisediminis 2691 TaxID=1196031 RepID=A0A160MA43_9BACI|nr:recombinase family protein [Cytobacillus oceanisediminis]AND39607.1 hypothetical protein A361_10820 [Cytobacillus oceanisediminis 2691]